jgi:hypothetical protein
VAWIRNHQPGPGMYLFSFVFLFLFILFYVISFLSICFRTVPFECRTCQIVQKLASVRIYSISTTQHGREEDYAAILDLVAACGGRVAAPLVKTEIPATEHAQASSKPAARKSTKRVVTAKDLADLMGSLNFDGGGKIDIPEKEISQWLADGVVLKPHQLTAVAWMDEAEKGKFSGGILADDMGMVGTP